MSNRGFLAQNNCALEVFENVEDVDDCDALNPYNFDGQFMV